MSEILKDAPLEDVIRTSMVELKALETKENDEERRSAVKGWISNLREQMVGTQPPQAIFHTLSVLGNLSNTGCSTGSHLFTEASNAVHATLELWKELLVLQKKSDVQGNQLDVTSSTLRKAGSLLKQMAEQNNEPVRPPDGLPID